MADTIEKIDDWTIQHGPFNNRIYLMKPGSADAARIVGELDRMADEKGYTKIFAKVQPECADVFFERGYKQEALVPGFFGRDRDGFFLSKFFSEERKLEKDPDKMEKALELALRKRRRGEGGWQDKSVPVEECSPKDAKEIGSLYDSVFETYPFPIHDPRYVKNTMRDNVRYFRVRGRKRIAALASCEMDEEHMHAEMTDFATRPGHRGKGLGGVILEKMERVLRREGFRIAYSIARATSVGMNVTFAKNGYIHAGTLVNNTNICGRFESMNVWYKNLKKNRNKGE